MPIGDEKKNTKNYNVQFNRTRILYLYYLYTRTVHFGFVNYIHRTRGFVIIGVERHGKVFFVVTRGFRAMLVICCSVRNNILRGDPL